MLETITPAQMKALEEDFMTRTGVPGALLMEMAAQAVCQAVTAYAPAGGRVLFLCGPGNNGGDGYAAARLWQMRGGRALVWELAQPRSGDAAMNRRLLLMQGITPALPEAELPAGVACVVDALFGTGLTRPLSGEAARLAKLCAASGLPVVAVDIPSGLNGTDGRGEGAFEAAETVTFHRIKTGLLLGEGPRCVGRLTVAPIGIPADWGDIDGLRLMTGEAAAALCPPRPRLSHKGSFGRVLILAGSPGMAGAAALCAQACMRTGAGLTRLACRASLMPTLQALAPCATCLPLPETDGRLDSRAAEVLREAAAQADAIAVGCGLGQQEDLLPLLEVLAQAACPVLWDADALNLLARMDAPPRKAGDLLTPHPGEAARLLDWEPSRILKEPLAALHALQARWGGAVLLKGACSLMTDGRHDAVDSAGTAALAKGGSGDVLAGILTALCAQRQRLGLDPLTTLQLGSFLLGQAGQRAARCMGETAVTALDTVQCLRWPGDLLPETSI